MNRFSLGSTFTGAALITTGCALAWHPLGFIVGGLFLLYAGVASTKGNK